MMIIVYMIISDLEYFNSCWKYPSISSFLKSFLFESLLESLIKFYNFLQLKKIEKDIDKKIIELLNRFNNIELNDSSYLR